MSESKKKFRAWDIKNKGYIAGFNMTNYHDYYNAGLKPSIYRYSTEWEDGDYILEQYSGLPDSEGVDIYESDAVYISGYGIYIAKFPFQELYDAAMENDIGAIQGNINTNPELIEA